MKAQGGLLAVGARRRRGLSWEPDTRSSRVPELPGPAARLSPALGVPPHSKKGRRGLLRGGSLREAWIISPDQVKPVSRVV